MRRGALRQLGTHVIASEAKQSRATYAVEIASACLACLAMTARLDRALRPGIGVEIAPIAGRRDVAGADDEVAEALARDALARVSAKQGIEPGDDLVVLQVLGIELGQARSVEGGAEIEIVAARSFADQADLGDVGPRAAVGAARHADHDVVGREIMRRHPRAEHSREVAQNTLARRERE